MTHTYTHTHTHTHTHYVQGYLVNVTAVCILYGAQTGVEEMVLRFECRARLIGGYRNHALLPFKKEGSYYRQSKCKMFVDAGRPQVVVHFAAMTSVSYRYFFVPTQKKTIIERKKCVHFFCLSVVCGVHFAIFFNLVCVSNYRNVYVCTYMHVFLFFAQFVRT